VHTYAIMTSMNGAQETAEVIAAFDSTVPDAGRRELLDALAHGDAAVRRGLDTSFRTTDPDQATAVTIAVLTMLSAGFVQYLGERAADRLVHLFTATRDWLRRRQPESTAPVQIEVVDQVTGLEFRVSAGDPDAAGLLLAEAIRAAHAAQQIRPLRWVDDRWQDSPPE
jgi:hypothetical protein